MHVACRDDVSASCERRLRAWHYGDFNGELAVLAQGEGALAELVDNLELLVCGQAVHLLEVAASVWQRRVGAASVFYAGAQAVGIGLLQALGALTGDICLDAFAGLDVGFLALGGELFLGKGPVAVLRGSAI